MTSRCLSVTGWMFMKARASSSSYTRLDSRAPATTRQKTRSSTLMDAQCGPTGGGAARSSEPTIGLLQEPERVEGLVAEVGVCELTPAELPSLISAAVIWSQQRRGRRSDGVWCRTRAV
jgi:hypothetical protein